MKCSAAWSMSRVVVARVGTCRRNATSNLREIGFFGQAWGGVDVCAAGTAAGTVGGADPGECDDRGRGELDFPQVFRGVDDAGEVVGVDCLPTAEAGGFQPVTGSGF